MHIGIYSVARHLTECLFTFFAAAVWSVTVALIIATCVILDDETSFSLVVVALLFILPLWRYVSQSYKRRLDGPWSLPTNLLESSAKRT